MSVIRHCVSVGFRLRPVPKLTLSKLRSFSSAADSGRILGPGWADVNIPKVTVPELVFSKIQHFEKFTATECGITGRKYTYGDVMRMSRNLGKALRKRLNLKEGDVVAVLLPNVPEFPISILGAMDAGLIITTLNPIYTATEISRQLIDSSAKVLITLNELWNVAKSSVDIVKEPIPILTIRSEQSQSLPQGALDFREFTDNTLDFPEAKPRSPDDVTFIPYSSGTTGLPKGVLLTHTNIVANVSQNLSPELKVFEEATDSYQECTPCVLPFFHIYGFTVTNLCTMLCGAKIVTLPRFTPDSYISALKKHKPQVLFVVPPIVLFLTGHPEVKKEDLKPLRLLFSGAAPLGALDEARFVEKSGEVSVRQGYGLTETSPTVTVSPGSDVPGTIGKPICNTFVKIVGVDDRSGTPLGPNSSGELLVKGPQVMKGYHNKPDATKEIFLDGWLKTGDLAHYNEQGLLFITDRLKELIKVKGYQVPPAELEEIIRNFPDVEDAAVIGVPHGNQGEVPRAYVVPKKKVQFNPSKLNSYVNEKVAEYKRLVGGIAVVESIPKNLSGKILRRELKLKYLKEAGLSSN